jgi:hypothetical protein
MKHCRTTQINKLLLHFSEAEFNKQKKGMTESPYLHCRTVFRWGRRCASQEESGQHDCDALGVVLTRPLTMLVRQWRQQAMHPRPGHRRALAVRLQCTGRAWGGCGRRGGRPMPRTSGITGSMSVIWRRRGAVRSGSGKWWAAGLEGGGA